MERIEYGSDGNPYKLSMTTCIDNSEERMAAKYKEHIFELSFALDSQSAGKDYPALRNSHYKNQKWIHDNGLMEEYYHYFIKKQFGEAADAQDDNKQ